MKRFAPAVLSALSLAACGDSFFDTSAAVPCRVDVRSESKGMLSAVTSREDRTQDGGTPAWGSTGVSAEPDIEELDVCRETGGPCIRVSISSMVVITMRTPPRPGVHSLADLDAMGCLPRTTACTAVRGTIDVEEMTPSCGEQGCARFAAVLRLEPPAEGPVPLVSGETRIQMFEERASWCAGGAR